MSLAEIFGWAIYILLFCILCIVIFMLEKTRKEQVDKDKVRNDFYGGHLTVRPVGSTICEHDLLNVRLFIHFGAGRINHLHKMHEKCRTLLFTIAKNIGEKPGEMFEIDASSLCVEHDNNVTLMSGGFNVFIQGRNAARITEILQEFDRQAGNGVHMKMLAVNFAMSDLAVRKATQEAKDDAFGRIDKSIHNLAETADTEDTLFQHELLNCKRRIAQTKISSHLKRKGKYLMDNNYVLHLESLPVSEFFAGVRVELSPREQGA